MQGQIQKIDFNIVKSCDINLDIDIEINNIQPPL